VYVVLSAVYIEEAHPTDGWAFPGNIPIRQHRTLEERMSAAAQLITTSPSLPSNMSVVVDNMSNELNIAYGGLYERLYVIHGGKVAYQGGRGPLWFRPEEVDSWLRMYRDTVRV